VSGTVYRAEQVGSFLRPPDIKEAHTAHRAGRLSDEDLRQLEDAAILRVLELQQQIGIDVFSDGEFRRGGWSGDFVEAVEGYAPGAPAVTVFNTAAGNAPGQRPAAQGRVIAEKLRQKHRLTEHK
jgi:5-methyltetrahydropteroyltriglutamate--homocysteine methyltransferase